MPKPTPSEQAIADDPFDSFIRQRRPDLQRIARHTGGESELGDVVNEAWILAQQLKAAGGEPLNLTESACQERLLSHLYQHLVRYTEQNVRRAVRLDHAPAGSDADDVHPLAHMLVSNGGSDPLSELLAAEAAAMQGARQEADGSLAAAYVLLLRRFDNKMAALAEHLLISTSYAYRRCAHARWLSTHMSHIPVGIADGAAVPRPWRRFRLHRQPVQLTFDFSDELPLLFAA